MFITLGAATILIGIIVLLYLPDHPMNAKFLTTEEKVAVLRHVSINMTGVANRTPRPRELLEALRDLQILLLIFPGIFVSAQVLMWSNLLIGPGFHVIWSHWYLFDNTYPEIRFHWQTKCLA
jgi:hypothetical protein